MRKFFIRTGIVLVTIFMFLSAFAAVNFSTYRLLESVKLANYIEHLAQRADVEIVIDRMIGSPNMDYYNYVLNQLRNLQAHQVAVIKVQDCPGGLVRVGQQMQDLMEKSPAAIIVKTSRMSASMCGLIPFSGDYVIVTPSTRLMFHLGGLNTADGQYREIGLAPDRVYMPDWTNYVLTELYPRYQIRAKFTETEVEAIKWGDEVWISGPEYCRRSKSTSDYIFNSNEGACILRGYKTYFTVTKKASFLNEFAPLLTKVKSLLY